MKGHLAQALGFVLSGDRTVLSNCTQVGSSVTCERQDYLTEWQYQAFVTLGLSYYFL